MKLIKIIIATAIACAILLSLSGCKSDAATASHNVSEAAENFEINRRIVFYNGITGEYILVLEGFCSLEDQKNQLEVTCKVAEEKHKKHFLGLSHNVSYFAEQIEAVKVSEYHYRVTFKPQIILPDVDLRVSTKDLPKNQK